ncbi:ABC transporter permease [bacterium]|nr:ABC transporter permease [candidate division CSSED10-310 bacterium]
MIASIGLPEHGRREKEFSVWKDIVEIVRYRALISALVSRELKARYRGSLLGFLWSLLNPLLLMLVYWLVFSIYMRFGMKNYHVFLFCGLLPWVWFSSSVLEGCNSIISGSNLVKKVLFPAEILPIVVIIANLIHFLLAIPILIFFLLVSGIPIGINIVWFPVIVLVQFIFTMAVVLLLAALSVHYRDIQQILNNLVTLWFFLSPIIYPMSGLPSGAQKYLWLMDLNPVAHLMVGYHRSFLQLMDDGSGMLSFNRAMPWEGLGGVALFSIVFLVISYRIFGHFKVSFSEEV